MAFQNLSAVFINCSLKRSNDESHTQRLMDKAISEMTSQGVEVSVVRAADHDIPPGVQMDMTKEGWDADEWPPIQQRIYDADIVVIGTPIWLGEKSSVCSRVIERMYGYSGELDERGQYKYYGRVGGCVVTGNEDGGKHCARDVLYALSHLGFTIPPQADSCWLGEAGPGPSYGDDGAGLDNNFTNRTIKFMAWNLMHVANMLKQAGGIPDEGNNARKWQEAHS